jgi:hypothetical protein
LQGSLQDWLRSLLRSAIPHSSCLPIVYDLDCAESGNAVLQVWDPYNDPHGLHVYNGVGNGWTCDGVG